MDKEQFVGLDRDLHELTIEEQEIWFNTWIKDLIDLDQLEKELDKSKQNSPEVGIEPTTN